MRFDFICEEHKEYGLIGWRPKDQPDFDPLLGMGTAHDCLEHFRGGDESPADEFQALGASYRLRGVYNYSRHFEGNVNEAYAHLGADMPDIFEHVYDQGMGLSAAPASAYKPLRGKPEMALRAAMVEGLKNIRERYEGEDDETRPPASEIAAFYRDGLAWMRHGFRRSGKRFGSDCYEFMYLFREIHKEADAKLNEAEIGDTLRVQVILKSKRANVELVRREDEDY